MDRHGNPALSIASFSARCKRIFRRHPTRAARLRQRCLLFPGPELLSKTATRTLHRFGVRVNRYKLTRKADIRGALLNDGRVAAAVREHAREHGIPALEVWRQVNQYVDEMVPYFNILAYYRLGYPFSRVVLNMLYKVSVDYADLPALRELPNDSTVIYLANHRSNADYVLLAYALAGDVSISYAVGEWARAFPLEYVFKSFGSYFIRRRFREPLYHTVLERYVQLITGNGVTQGIFPEGGLTRDGTLRPAKIGLLDYMLGAARDDPALAQRLTIIPVALNYDRVLEDRTLLRELARQQGETTTSRLTQLSEVGRYVGWNVGRLTTGRWKRYGRAAVTFGAPIRVAPWLDDMRRKGVDFWSLPRTERLPHVQALADHAMERIGALLPVTPVPLACAAIQSFDGDFIPRSALLERMSAMRDALTELNAKVLSADRSIEETFDRAWRMLAMRRILVAEGSGFAVMSRQRPLVSYYANSIVHLLGPFARGVREREAFEIDRAGS